MHKRNMVSGLIRAEITAADPTQILGRLNNAQISLYNVQNTSDLSVEITFHKSQLKNVRSVLNCADINFTLKKSWGLLGYARRITSRLVLLCCFIFILFSTLYIPRKVLFFKVDGNQQLSSKLILEKAEDCGIHFGVSRKVVRSEKMKNALLASIPELEWAGINTNGCVATISVKEKEQSDISQRNALRISSVIASRDGVVLSCDVVKGIQLCKPGQAVKRGQILVSGYTDCGIKIKATQAEAEIIAQTYHTIRTLSLLNNSKRGTPIRQNTKYSLLIGKKLINFYKDSGIYDTTCAKIYEQNYIMLPGGFTLPIALISETWLDYETELVACNAEELSWVNYATDEYLLSQMVAGEILSKKSSMYVLDNICLVQGNYICVEMIGQVRNEETICKYGEYYGENR